MRYPRMAPQRALVVMLGLLAVVTGASADGDCTPTCPTASIGVSPELADTTVLGYETRGYGETFYADHTCIKSISVWRPKERDPYALPLQVTLMGVDTTGRPDPFNVLGYGPVLVVPVGDGIYPVEYRFEFDPPFALPGEGQYFFRIHIADCFGGFVLLATRWDSYVGGKPWFIFGNRYACGVPTHPDLQLPGGDLAFRVELCDFTTDTRHSSWGGLKKAFRENRRTAER